MSLDLFTESSAAISPCGKYRYSLTREWGGGPHIAFVMLNPSTADASKDDPTIRKCIGFARRWGAGSLSVVNLFAYRATKPSELPKVADPIGPFNDEYILQHASQGRVIAAWGADTIVESSGRAAQVLSILGDRGECLGWTKGGHPRHPLYVSYEVHPVRLPQRTQGGAK